MKGVVVPTHRDYFFCTKVEICMAGAVFRSAAFCRTNRSRTFWSVCLDVMRRSRNFESVLVCNVIYIFSAITSTLPLCVFHLQQVMRWIKQTLCRDLTQSWVLFIHFLSSHIPGFKFVTFLLQLQKTVVSQSTWKVWLEFSEKWITLSYRRVKSDASDMKRRSFDVANICKLLSIVWTHTHKHTHLVSASLVSWHPVEGQSQTLSAQLSI